MILLLTNDDGIDAPGIAALEKAAQGLGEVWIVAPTQGYSGCSHQVTTHAPVRAHPRGPRRYAVEGTPADCIRLAVHGLVPRPDYVLSGINAGGNLGVDVFLSGTVAAVREATLHGWAGIALSQYRRRDRPFDWDRTAHWASHLLPTMLRDRPELGVFWNVNFPHLDSEAPDPEAVLCPFDLSPLPLNYREDIDGWVYAGDYHSRPRQPGTDVAVCFGGQVAVSLLGLDAVSRK